MRKWWVFPKPVTYMYHTDMTCSTQYADAVLTWSMTISGSPHNAAIMCIVILWWTSCMWPVRIQIPMATIEFWEFLDSWILVIISQKVWWLLKHVKGYFSLATCYPKYIPYSGKLWWGESLANLANRPWFAKLKPSKLVLSNNNLLADLLIRQTFFRQQLNEVYI